MAETIAKVLYPEDNHYEGKSLRLKQQYFFVSATVQSIVTKHLETYGTLKNFHEKNVIQINDTHPALVIPELMRIFMDEAGMNWDEAWDITSRFPRDGRCIEEIGTFDPKAESAIVVDADKAKQWIKNGAQPTDTVRGLLKKANVL